jgi:hypothetical protein
MADRTRGRETWSGYGVSRLASLDVVARQDVARQVQDMALLLEHQLRGNATPRGIQAVKGEEVASTTVAGWASPETG